MYLPSDIIFLVPVRLQTASDRIRPHQTAGVLQGLFGASEISARGWDPMSMADAFDFEAFDWQAVAGQGQQGLLEQVGDPFCPVPRDVLSFGGQNWVPNI